MAKTKNTSIMKFIYQGLPKLYFVLQIIVGMFSAYWLLFNHQPETGDDVEHLHSSWLVSQGYTPYKDFFQHHNPLMWYLFIPVLRIFSYNIAVFDAVRIISTIVMLFTLFTAGMIVKRFICKSWYSLLLVIASCFPSYVVFTGQDFRPDSYMALTFVLGIYFFFCYLEKNNAKSLIISFLLMFISFLFMQKIIFMLAVFGAIVIYYLYKKEIKINDFCKALVLPIVGAVLFIIWLLLNDMLVLYWKSNYTFNLLIPDVYGNIVEKTKTEFYVLMMISFIGCLFAWYKGNKYIKIISIIWVAEAIQRLFYFSLNRHYYYLLLILNAILAGYIIYTIITKYNWTAYLFVILSILSLIVFRNFCLAKKLNPNFHRYATPKYIIEQTNRCDVVLNGYGLTYGIFTNDATYYWNLNGQLDVIGEKVGIAPLPNLDKAVLDYLPKIIYTLPYWDEKLRQQKINKPVHIVDSGLRDKYYDQSLFVGLFILKPEYQKIRRCRYNIKTNKWQYYYKG